MSNFNARRKLYVVWSNMKKRCDNPLDPGYRYYGAKGITYSTAWQTFENFYQDLYYLYSPGLELDRIDEDKDYSKENCQFITSRENIRKSSATKLTARKVVLIRAIAAAVIPQTPYTYICKVLAEVFKVSSRTIDNILCRDTWKDIA